MTMFVQLLLVFLLGAAAVAAATDSGDAAAMRALARSLGADKSSLSWSGANPCTWDGVSCSGDGRVTAIYAGNRSLAGSLGPEIRNLTALTRLELQLNQLSGDLPPLAGLDALQVVLLHSNQFASLPPGFFAGMSALAAVSLDDNPFSPWPLPLSLADCAALVNFSANGANITGGIPAFLNATNFPSLSRLSLAYNFLSGPVPAGLAELPLLQLWLNNQQGSSGRLSGSIAFIANMTSLEELWLQSNDFTGPLPDLSALTVLQDLQLRDNQLTGPVPASLPKLPKLARLTLTNNLLQGAPPVIPASVKTADVIASTESFCVDLPSVGCDSRVNTLLDIAAGLGYPAKLAESWKGNDPCAGQWLGIDCNAGGNITVVNFAKMGLNGTISSAFAGLSALQRLLLQGNNLTGRIPAELARLPALKVLDVSNNHLYGKVPAFASNVLLNTDGNPDIGKDGPSSPSASSQPANSNGVPKSIEGAAAVGSGWRGSSSHSVGAIVGSVIVVAAAVGAIVALVLYCYRQKQQPSSSARVLNPNAMVVHPRHSGSDPDTVKITVAGQPTNGSMVTSDTYSRSSSSPGEVHVVDTGNMVISIQVLRNVTNNFSDQNVIGRGGFGTVYRGELHDGTKIAVKRMECGVMSNKALNEFRSEIDVLTKVRHRNLVSLLGYCLDGNERILVYEYMPQGTLSRHLFDWKDENLQPLEWKKRLSIALDVARGVEYLHSLAHQSFIHRDLKPSNILLGDDMKAKVADFGLVRLAPADGKCVSVETRLAGTFGYLAPEYAVTGRVTTKADVFSFGVILMELITGRKALDESQPEENMHLVTWFRRTQLNPETFSKQAIDPTIWLTDDTLASINKVAELAGHCCAREPHQRPEMGHAVNVLSTLAEVWKPADPDSDDSYGIDLDMTLPQALKKWQASEDSAHFDDTTSSFLADLDSTQTSIPSRPPGFAESFTSADGR